MYIDYNIRRPSIREAIHFDTTSLRNVNTKKLEMMNKNAKKMYVNSRYHGGRLYLGRGAGLKSFLKKVGKFAKKAYTKVVRPMYKKVVKPGLNFLTQNETGKALVNTVSSVMSQAAEMVPVVGPVIAPIVKKELPTVLGAADSITTAAENIVQSIKDRNPQITVQQGKDIYNTIKKTYDSLSEDIKQTKAEQMKKIEQNLPDTIKAEGYESVFKAAPFLPIVDLTTLKEESVSGRGGKLKRVYKVRKPTGADKYGKYSAPIVARVAGRMFLSGSCGTDPVRMVSKIPPTPKKITKVSGGKTMDLLEELRAKYA